MSKDKVLLGFVMFPGFTGLDLIGPHEILSRSETKCLFVAKTLEPVISDRNVRVLPDVTFAGCPNLDVLIVPGGPGQTPAMEDAELLSFLVAQSTQARFAASVCTGTLLLAQAGLLRDRKAATHWLAREELLRLGGIPSDERVTWDGKFLSGAGVSAGIDMALSLVTVLFGPEEAQRIQLAIEYDPQPPFDTGSPEKAPEDLVNKLRST